MTSIALRVNYLMPMKCLLDPSMKEEKKWISPALGDVLRGCGLDISGPSSVHFKMKTSQRAIKTVYIIIIQD
jgi:hypothetical protein